MDAALGKYIPHRYYSPAVQTLVLRVLILRPYSSLLYELQTLRYLALRGTLRAEAIQKLLYESRKIAPRSLTLRIHNIRKLAPRLFIFRAEAVQRLLYEFSLFEQKLY